MAQLTPFGPGLWLLAAPLKMLGLQLGTRMTVIRLDDGSVVLHSPVVIDDTLAKEIEAIGPVRHIIAPNTFHHLYVGSARDHWPEARVYGPEALKKKRPDLRLDTYLNENADLPFASELQPVTIDGTLFHETVLVHKATKTLVSSDLLENFPDCDHLLTRIYLKVNGVYGKPGWSRILRLAYRDHKAARASMNRLLALDFDRVILAHGVPVERDAHDVIEASYKFLDS
ncbi:DUF4336 domain-containing protein [Chondromyces crocatus]|uniref:DUF4336 domain-containing protein n=1 Tax=Chondromyces crocatus TaxID=52 RepID=A0A0K1EBU1_CHOCO|nr:DUF4336 domain-containing protein [Chondromyces crocatus]AKT38043.1 uncharacterized protein CMC5_021840 [Chondromyces crocatus]